MLNQKRPARTVVLAVACALLAACSTCAYAQRRRPSSSTNAQQERPRRISEQKGERNAKTDASSINVRAGGDLQGAIERAQPGDTIMLEPGATFRVSIVLPRKDSAGNKFITIRSAAPDAQLPAEGERLDPSRYAALLPKIVSTAQGKPAVFASNGAHHYRFMFIEFGATPEGTGNIITLGTGEEKSLEELPHHIELDRVYVHGDPAFGQRRGIAMNGRALRVLNSHFSDIKRKGEESQALCGWGGDGPFEITNNYIEAAAEGIMFGGAAPVIRLVPSDIIIRDNHFNKPLKWRNEEWIVKNHLEFKSGRRAIIDHNLMTNNWSGAQDGTAVLFTVRAEFEHAPQAIIEDVFFVNNTVRGAGGALNIYGADARGGHRLTVRNNVFEDIDERWGGGGKFMKVTEWDTLTIENNTIINTGRISGAYGKPTTRFVFRNNVVANGDYGFHGDGHAPGDDSLRTYFPGHSVTHNAIVGGEATPYSGRNMYPASWKQLKFTDMMRGDFTLRADSPLKRAGYGGSDIGAQPDARFTATLP
ncbi:MAG TPA: right-handed parallel beta-helix repeat-containing protein [Pyrinomonadaceae bacterium]|jgi:hypothetical protein